MQAFRGVHRQTLFRAKSLSCAIPRGCQFADLLLTRFRELLAFKTRARTDHSGHALFACCAEAAQVNQSQPNAKPSHRSLLTGTNLQRIRAIVQGLSPGRPKSRNDFALSRNFL